MAARTKHQRRATPTSSGNGQVRVAILTRISTDEVNQPYSLDA
jgi:hypothetical protein